MKNKMIKINCEKIIITLCYIVFFNLIYSCGSNNSSINNDGKVLSDKVKTLLADHKSEELIKVEEDYRDKKFTFVGVTINGGGWEFFLRNISMFPEVDGRFVKKTDSISLLNFGALINDDDNWISTGCYSNGGYPRIKFNCYFNNNELLATKKLSEFPFNFHGDLMVGKNLEDRLNGLYIIPSLEYQHPSKEINFFGNALTPTGITDDYFKDLLSELCQNKDELTDFEHNDPDKVSAEQQEITSFENYLKKVVDNANLVALKEDKELENAVKSFIENRSSEIIEENNHEGEQIAETESAYDPQSDQGIKFYSNENYMINKLKEFIFAADKGFVFYIADADIKVLYKVLDDKAYSILSKEGSCGPDRKVYMKGFSEFLRQKFTIVGDFKTIDKYGNSGQEFLANIVNCKINKVEYVYPEIENVLKRSKINTTTIKSYLQKNLNADMYNKVVDTNKEYLTYYSESDYKKLMESLAIKYSVIKSQEVSSNE